MQPSAVRGVGTQSEGGPPASGQDPEDDTELDLVADTGYNTDRDVGRDCAWAQASEPFHQPADVHVPCAAVEADARHVPAVHLVHCFACAARAGPDEVSDGYARTSHICCIAKIENCEIEQNTRRQYIPLFQA